MFIIKCMQRYEETMTYTEEIMLKIEKFLKN